MAHLTCVGTPARRSALVQQFLGWGWRNLLALRGDPPAGQREFHAAPGGFRYAAELVRFIRERTTTSASAGRATRRATWRPPLRDDDLRHLKAKVDAGLDFVITQLFFDNAFYFDFVERARRVGINVPIVPGIMPITNIEQLERFVRLCGATVPMRLVLQLERYKDDPDAVVQLGVAHATVQCMELLARGVPGIHFYTLNKSPATRLIVSALRGRGAAPARS
jgi:methylenetetrahydrofolate reductase (NADPH)